MKAKLLGTLVLLLGLFLWGLGCEFAYSISDTPPQFPDNRNPYWNTERRSGPLRPVKMPYGEIQDPRDWRTVYPDSGPGSRRIDRRRR